MARIALAVAFSFLSFAATAQAPDPAQQVQLLAPQLVPFSGSTANFQSLATGLVQGTPITLTGVTADGLPVSPDDKQKILSGNAKRLLRI